MKKNKGWCWCVHHEVKLEYCTDFAGRVDYIKKYKSAHERPIRLNALRFVKGKLPAKLVKAHAAWANANVAYNNASYDPTYDKPYAVAVKAYKAFHKICATRDKACATYDKVYSCCLPQINVLFKKECSDVPWDEKAHSLKF
jgi:hypothetical protein